MKILNYWRRFKGRRPLTTVTISPPQLLVMARLLIRRRTRLVTLKCITFNALIVLIIMGFMTSSHLPSFYHQLQRSRGDYNLSQNYLQSSWLSSSKRGYLVDNSKCRIPNLDIWSAEVEPFFEQVFKPEECQDEKWEGTINGLTFVRKQAIVINETLLRETLGLTMNDIDCCYQTIDRVQQTYGKYDKYADSTFQYSDVCHPMTSAETTPSSGFTKVTCTQKTLLGWFWDTQIHTDLHLLASFEKASSRDISNKLTYWKNRSVKDGQVPRPPNVLLLGIDSTTRMNFRRFMPETRKLLEEVFGAVEMGGYTKVAENTFPNFVPLMSSFSVEELVNICHKTPLTAQDECPYIWRNFSDTANYLTAHIEDKPNIAIFNYHKTGFVFPPVDIYPRPWMQATYSGSWKSMQCVGPQRPDQIVIRYVVDLVELAEAHGLPYFITTWLTDLTHEYVNSLQSIDAVLKDALKILHERGHLQNTVLLVMSDHGYRYYPIRKTTSGWFEDKLPALWMSLPETLKKSRPTWEDALRHNSRQLATPFDMHQTLRDILGISTKLESRMPKSLRGRSLFEKLPERNCSEAGVPTEYCPCGSLFEYTGSVSEIETAAGAVIEKINRELPFQFCTRLGFDRITATAVIGEGTQKKLVIGMGTAPEDIEIEAFLIYNDSSRGNSSSTGYWQVVNVLRTNRVVYCDLVKEGERSFFCQCQCGIWWKLFGGKYCVEK